MDYFDFIDAYKTMKSIPDICKETKVDYSNLINKKTTAENAKKVAEKIKIEVIKIYSLINFLEDK